MDMRRRIPPGTVLTIGLTLASIAFVMWAVQTTVVEPGPFHDEAREVLSESPAQKAMQTRLAQALALTRGVDPAALDALVVRTMEQPEFVEAFAGALDRVQGHVVDGTTGAITLDPGLVTRAVAAAATGNPQVNATLATQNPVVVQIPDDEIPDLAQWARLWVAVLRGLALCGLLLVAYGLFASDHRVWAFGRVGRWAIVVGSGTVVVFWLVPRVLVRPMGGWIAIGGAVAGASEQLVPVALALVALGALAVIAAHRWGDSDRERILSAIPARRRGRRPRARRAALASRRPPPRRLRPRPAGRARSEAGQARRPSTASPETCVKRSHTRSAHCGSSGANAARSAALIGPASGPRGSACACSHASPRSAFDTATMSTVPHSIATLVISGHSSQSSSASSTSPLTSADTDVPSLGSV